MDKSNNKPLSISNSLQNLLFPPGKYNISQLINLSPQFNGVLTLQKFKQIMAQKLQMPNQERIWWVVKTQYGQVNAKVMLVTLMLQLFGKEKREHQGFNEASKNIQHSSSPRNKSNRALIVSNDQILILNYVKDNMQNFLRLLSNQSNNQDPLISPQQMQPLSILFRVDRSKQFSSYLTVFNGSQKQKASIIAEHLSSRIILSQQQIVNLEGLRFSVIIKQVAQCKDKDLKIIGCYDSQIFIDSPVRSLYIVGCGSCNIYVAACERIALIDKCQKISLTISANLLRVCNSMDSNIYSYSQSPIILTGDNRSINIGPNNSSSKDLKNHIKAANMTVNKGFLNNFENVICRSESNCFQIMKPVDFDILVLPLKQNEQNSANNSDLNILAPEIYIKQLQQRNNYYNSVKSNISKGGLNLDMQKHLHSSLQGHFKDWLIAKGHNKNLIDLVKMIDKK